MSELALYPIEDLVKELSSRFDGLIICGLQKNLHGGKTDRYYQYYSGSLAMAKGLVFVIDDHLNCVWADIDDQDTEGEQDL